MEAADLLRTVRTRNGMTQAELARAARTSQPVISAYEHGRREPTLPTLRRLVHATGERLEVRAERRGHAELPPPADRAEHGRRLLAVLSLADAVPRRRRGRLEFPRIDSA